jgi:hypothetical protein
MDDSGKINEKCVFCDQTIGLDSRYDTRSATSKEVVLVGKPIGSKWICVNCIGDLVKAMEIKEICKKTIDETMTATMRKGYR